jgi:tRNA/tmRNA/rRNA uracil-C5-methylase (TrmA/RlmC/RlmD family)
MTASHTFASIVLALAKASPGTEPLAHLDYPQELAIKTAALRQFWDQAHLHGTPNPVAPSPKPRGYRTTTKRRVSCSRGKVYVHFEDAPGDQPVAASLLEPTEHQVLYRLMHEKLSGKPYRHLATHVNYLIIRGSYQEFCVLFNVDALDAEIVRKCRLLADHARAADPRVKSAFIFHDPLRSRYYFESCAPEGSLRLKKLFGFDQLQLRIENRQYRYAPTIFSQVNESMLPVMLSRVRSLVRPSGHERLIDLYCGYGLFALDLADRCGEVIGIDANESAIASARGNARFAPESCSVRFIADSITPASLMSALQRLLRQAELLILDPPRQGTAEGVIEYCASRKPARAAHIFCGVDQIPRELREWERMGYRPAAIEPLDMFAGTPNLEVVIGLEQI